MFTIQNSINQTNGKINTSRLQPVDPVADPTRYVVKISVRKLVEFLLRSGDLGTGQAALASQDLMLEGGRLHRKIQRQQGPDYESEVPLSETFSEEDFDLILEGRADGIETVCLEEEIPREGEEEEVPGSGEKEGREGEKRSSQITMIDEIKCTRRMLPEDDEPDPLHLAQAMCYAAMYAKANREDRMLVQITYCHMETETIKRIRREYSAEELEKWYGDLIEECKTWADYCVKSRKKRDGSIRKLAFPFPYRPGQKQLMAMAFHTMDQAGHVFLQAPTGVGKTISMIYPALQEMGLGHAQRLYYLTAKTITRTVAQDTFSILRKQDLSLKSLTITAKEKICILEEVLCDPDLCPRARGHYDRINACLFDMLTHRDDLTRNCILEYSGKHKVCPYELAFEAAAFADAVICDYNYVFDPHVSRGSLLAEQNAREAIFLIDEAHNLMDRAREMYSADLGRQDFREPKKIFKDKSKKVYQAIRRCDASLRDLAKAGAGLFDSLSDSDANANAINGLLADDPDGGNPFQSRFIRREPIKGVTFFEEIDRVYHPLFHMLERLTDYLMDHESFEEREEVLDFYFKASHFFMILDTMDEGYRIWSEGEKMYFTLHLHCINPSGKLEEYLESCRSGIFFSATLLPIPYYKSLLGGDKVEAYAIPSPFAEERRLLAVTRDVTSIYSQRGPDQYRRILHYLQTALEKKTGNYIVFFPSYEMLTHVTDTIGRTSIESMADLVIQEPAMGEEEREEFLDHFQENPRKSLVGFCVLGSIFSEGIDLVGSRLSGVLIVGTGLPKVCREREIIRDYFDSRQKKGYDYAYRYPGMNKVLQAAGRVIRTPSDRGIILLMDYRFLRKENLDMFPEDWKTYYPVNANNWGTVLENFWGEDESGEDV